MSAESTDKHVQNARLIPDMTGSDGETVITGRIFGSAESDGRRDVEDPYLASDLGEERIIRQLRNGF